MWAVSTAAVVLCGVLLQLAQLQPLHLAASPVLANINHQPIIHRNARSGTANLKQLRTAHNLHGVYAPRYYWQAQRKRADEQAPPPDDGPAQYSAAAKAPLYQVPRPMARSHRANRQYDVPQIECPSAADGMERFACPKPDSLGRYHCIDDHVLCDGFEDCPDGEDEDRQDCMFYKTTKAHLDVVADALLRWARGR